MDQYERIERVKIISSELYLYDKENNNLFDKIRIFIANNKIDKSYKNYKTNFLVQRYCNRTISPTK